MRFDEAAAALDARGAGRMVPDLSRISALADMLGEPQLSYPTIHVTGTNGKTTVARVTSAIACAHGLTTGLYTSPHLASVTERIEVCGEAISAEAFAATYTYLAPFFAVVDERGEDDVTYFEALTAMAYTYFADLPVHLGVFEVGMGGSWDATNLVAGDVAVLTPIALDHPELGPTLVDKTTEKAGIIKPDKIAVVREQPPAAMAVIEAHARGVGASLMLEDQDFGVEQRLPAVGGQVITVRGLHATYEEFFLNMFGEHAARNTAAAIAAMEAFSDQGLSEEPLREALSSVQSPGRLEVMGRHPLALLDGAHNPAGAQALAEALEEAFGWERLHLVVACSSDKDVPGILEPLAPLAAHAYATRYEGSRAMEPRALATACEAVGTEASAHDSLAEAIAAARAEADDADCILVTGSLLTVAEARELLR